jgi:hypothetical protein
MDDIEGFSSEGMTSFGREFTEEAYLSARAEFASDCDVAFNAELPLGKVISHPAIQGAFVNLSKALTQLAEAYFDRYADAIADLAKQDVANGTDAAMMAKWEQAVIQESSFHLWRDIIEVWDLWLAHVRDMTGGTVFGARPLPKADPEFLILTAHRRRMVMSLSSIADRHSLSRETVRALLETDHVIRSSIHSKVTRSSDLSRDDARTVHLGDCLPAIVENWQEARKAPQPTATGCHPESNQEAR